MQDRPTAAELLATIAELLEDAVLPATRGPLQHQVRVAANLCRILEREQALGPASDARERELLQTLVDGTEGEASELSRALADRLAAGGDLALERAAWPLLVEIVRGKLAIAKPGYDDYDFAAEASR
ncbi:MAG: DUF6285 domain-containing protein [Myxococcota bacterium]